MIIALDSQSTIGSKTGIGVYTSNLFNALRCVAPEHNYIELNQGTDVRMRLDRRLRWQQIEVPRRARAVVADVLHVPGFDAPVWKPCPVVLTVHDLIGFLFPRQFPPVSRFYWSRWLPFTLRFATHIMADSECTRQDIMRLLGVPEARITVVPMGVGPHYQPLTDHDRVQAVRQKYHLPARFILFVSTLEPRKGIDTLVEAFARVQSRHSDVELVITGKVGWYTDQFFAQVERLGLKGKIVFTGYVADDDLVALYNAAELLAFPSRYEGFGMPVLEAMACGTPVVCSSSSSLPEVAGDAALLVPPDDSDALAQALGQALEDGVLRQQMRNRGLTQAARFSWEQTARQTLAIYEKVLSQTR
jgi:glycosyltransferase involved in cell wall biosynthesis